jgi:hypothetical protein
MERCLASLPLSFGLLGVKSRSSGVAFDCTLEVPSHPRDKSKPDTGILDVLTVIIKVLAKFLGSSDSFSSYLCLPVRIVVGLSISGSELGAIRKLFGPNVCLSGVCRYPNDTVCFSIIKHMQHEAIGPCQ